MQKTRQFNLLICIALFTSITYFSIITCFCGLIGVTGSFDLSLIGQALTRLKNAVYPARGSMVSAGDGKKESAEWQVYLLRCADNTLYCGVTKDLEARVEKHNDGTASKYTRSRRPVNLIAQSPFMDKKAAYQMEYRIKRLPRDQKAGYVKKGKAPVR